MLRNKQSNMTIADVRSHLLHYLYRRKKPVTVGDLKSKTFGIPGSYDEVMNGLFQDGYVDMQENFVSLSPKGEHYMQEEERQEIERIQRLVFEDEFDLALLEFLSYRGTLVSLEDIPQLLKDYAYGHGFNDGSIHEVLFHLEQKGFVNNPFSQWYSITESGKDFYKYQISKFNQCHFVTDLASGSSNNAGSGISVGAVGSMTINQISGGNNQVSSPAASMSIGGVKEDSVAKELVRQQLDDMPKVKWYRKWGFWVGILALLVATYFGWMSLK